MNMNIENLKDLLQLGMDDVAKRLQAILNEESEANETLTHLAEREINLEATA